MKPDEAKSRGTEPGQEVFNVIMNHAAEGIEGAVRAFLAKDYSLAEWHLDRVDEGREILRGWLADAE